MNTHSINSTQTPSCSFATTCIVYDYNEPVHMFYNEYEAYDYMIRTGDRKMDCIKTILGKSNVNSFPADFVNIHMSIITHASNGVCSSFKQHFYCPHKNEKPVNQTHQVYQNNQCKSSLLSEPIKITTKSEPLFDHFTDNRKYFDPSICPQDSHQDNYQSSNNNNSCSQNLRSVNVNNSKKTTCLDNTFDSELIKLTKSLTETSEQNKKAVIPDLETVYSGVAEEALLDDEIKKMNKRFDDLISDTTSDSDSDLISSDDEELDDKYNNNDKYDKNLDQNKEIQITDDMPEELKHLIEVRNSLNNNIQKQSVVVNKANEKLNEDIFNKRCEDQDKRRKEQKYLEGISILTSDKNVYLKLIGKIKKGLLQEKNVPPFFMHKFHIIKFMEINECIEFTKHADTKSEYHIFSQLLKIVDLYELNDHTANTLDIHSDNSNDSVEYINDNEAEKNNIIDEIDPNYMNMCMDFLEILEQADGAITSDKKIHSILNENPEIKKKIFKEEVNTTFFEKDADMNHYKTTVFEKDDEKDNYKTIADRIKKQ